MILIKILYCLFLAIARRYWGSGKPLRGLLVPVIITTTAGLFGWKEWEGYVVGGLVSLLFASGFNDNWDFGVNHRCQNDLTPIIENLFKKYGRYDEAITDYTCMLIHFSFFSICISIFTNAWYSLTGLLITFDYLYWNYLRHKVPVAEYFFGFISGLFIFYI